MSGGITATTVLAYAAAASAAFGVYTAIESGKAEEQTADDNAEIARRNAAQDKDAAVSQAQKIREAAARQKAAATASLAGSGVDVGTGTAVTINDEITLNSEQDAFTTILSGSRSAQSSLNQAGMFESQGNNAKTAGYMNAGSSLLSAGASIASGWKSPATGTNSGSGFKANGNLLWGNS